MVRMRRPGSRRGIELFYYYLIAFCGVGESHSKGLGMAERKKPAQGKPNPGKKEPQNNNQNIRRTLCGAEAGAQHDCQAAAIGGANVSRWVACGLQQLGPAK